MLLVLLICFMAASSGVLLSSKRKNLQLVDLYVCAEGLLLAEMRAKAAVNRKDLLTVSYCTCEGVNDDMMKQARGGECRPNVDMVYSCVCVGKTQY